MATSVSNNAGDFEDFSDVLCDWSEDTPMPDLAEAEAGEIHGPVSGAAATLCWPGRCVRQGPTP